MKHISYYIANIVARQIEDKVYYFDKEGIYRSISIEEAKRHKEWRPNIKDDGRVSFGRTLFSYEVYYCAFRNTNQRLLKKAICQLKEGDSIEDLDSLLSIVKSEKHSKPEGLERFITKIGKPIFTRVPENQNKKTFDFIFIEVNIISEWGEDRKKYIDDHLKEIKEMVINKIKNSKIFQRYGVPVNFLKITRITLRKDSALEFVLELKTIE